MFMLKSSLPMSESQVKMRNTIASMEERCLVRGYYSNACMYSFTVFGCTMFMYMLAGLVL